MRMGELLGPQVGAEGGESSELQDAVPVEGRSVEQVSRGASLKIV
jgi:hypothetical protein